MGIKVTTKAKVWLGLGALALLGGYLYERRAGERFRARYGAGGDCRPPGRIVTVDGRAIHLVAAGSRRPGQPLVVLEAGHGAWSACWKKVMAGIAPHARVVAADRAGYAFSGPAPVSRSPRQMVGDLRGALRRAGEDGPYLLVGHSMGSALARLYASLYPGEVAGMVWVDPVGEDLARYLPYGRWIAGAAYAGLRLGGLLARLGLVRASGLARLISRYPAVGAEEDQDLLFELVAAPAYMDTLAAEMLVLFGPAGWQGSLPSFGDLPVTCLEAQYFETPPFPYPRWWWRRFRAGWRAMHDDLALSASRIRRIPVAGGHNIHEDHPELVIAAVLEMLGTA